MKTVLLFTAASILASATASAAPTDFTASGVVPADIQATVTAFNTAISLGGGNNGAGGGVFLTGRREINWDAAGLDAFQSPNTMPDNFFNNNSKRGSVQHSPFGSVKVSKRLADSTGKFGDVDASYNASFKTFSALRLFGVTGSNIVENTFFVPNTPGQEASINGFGAVFTDVDIAGSSAIEFYGPGNTFLRRIDVPVSADGLSFAGTFFGDGERITAVRIIAGNIGMGPGVLDGVGTDVVAMDDFFYSEPLAIPAPATLGLIGVGLVAGGRRRRVK